MEKTNKYDDIRGFNETKKFNSQEYSVEDIINYSYNNNTILMGSEDIQKEVMEKGLNPGLGIRKLHEQGISGKNITAAIIDQNVLLNHPEFKGKIIEYYDTGCNQDSSSGSMHGPAVVSLFVGNRMGTAPDTKIYYAAVPSWKADSRYYAEALEWIINKNKTLNKEDKIKVVSVSAAPSGYDVFKNQELWIEAVKKAQEEGILVIDCTNDKKTGFIGSVYYDLDDPDNITKCKSGYPNNEFNLRNNRIGAPSSRRTVAEEYVEGKPGYTYWGVGGQSWAIPYAAGVLCLGWQIKPNLSPDEIVNLLYKTSYIDENNNKIINPPKFIEEVNKTVV